jgi:thiol-disulfide isomerase/thioredoxin
MEVCKLPKPLARLRRQSGLPAAPDIGVPFALFRADMAKQIIGRGEHAVAVAGIFLVVTLSAAGADDTLPVLKVGSEVYSNVTVTSVTATDIYFSHARGMGNAKLKNLDPDLQKHFHFDPAKAGAVEKKRLDDNWQFRVGISTSKPATSAAPAGSRTSEVSYDDGDLVVTNLHAVSFRGQRPPKIIVDQWLTPPPEVEGKFVLVEFWATWSEACRQSIPHLNGLQAKFKDRLVIIGLSSETPEEVVKMTSPHMEYFVGVDTAGQTLRALEVQAIPHAILIDPKNIVRFEGMPTYLDNKMLQHLIDKYAD